MIRLMWCNNLKHYILPRKVASLSGGVDIRCINSLTVYARYSFPENFQQWFEFLKAL